MSSVFGVAAEFSSASDVLVAARKMREAGYRRWDVFSPVPVEGLDEVLGAGKSSVGIIAFIGGVIGFVLAVAMEIIPTAWLYPLDVAGKPAAFLFSPTIFPIIFETTVLFSACAALLGMIFLGGMPRLNHPMFNWERFDGVSRDKFVIALEASDPKFSGAAEFLMSLGAEHVSEVRDEP